MLRSSCSMASLAISGSVRCQSKYHVPVGKYRHRGLAGVKAIVLSVVYPRRFLQEVFASIGNKVWLVAFFGDLERGPRHRDPSASNSQKPADVDDNESHRVHSFTLSYIKRPLCRLNLIPVFSPATLEYILICLRIQGLTSGPPTPGSLKRT